MTVKEGWYLDPETDTVYKVQRNVAYGTGAYVYAKRLDPQLKRFVYARGLVSRIKPEWAMTQEQAAKFGKLYGVCAICGRALTDETSIENGIGPICIKKFGGTLESSEEKPVDEEETVALVSEPQRP